MLYTQFVGDSNSSPGTKKKWTMHKVTFSVHNYDSDGDIQEPGIYLHFGDTRVKVAENLEEFGAFIQRLKDMSTEIEENYRGV